MLEVNYKNKKYKVSCNMLNYIIRDFSISKEEVLEELYKGYPELFDITNLYCRSGSGEKLWEHFKFNSKKKKFTNKADNGIPGYVFLKELYPLKFDSFYKNLGLKPSFRGVFYDLIDKQTPLELITAKLIRETYTKTKSGENSPMSKFKKNNPEKYKEVSKTKSLKKKKIMEDKSNNAYSKAFWIKRGYSLEEAQAKVKERNKFCKDSYIKKGFTLEESEVLAKKANPSNLENYENVNDFLKKSPTRKEYWLELGYSLEEAKRLTKQYRGTTTEYWVKKGYSIQESQLKAKEKNCWCIEYWVKKGKTINDFENFKSEMFKKTCKSLGVGISNESKAFFKSLLSSLNLSSEYVEKNIFTFVTKSYEKCISGYFPDFVDEERKIIIEFNGDLFHANPLYFKDSDCPNPYNLTLTSKEVWERDKKRNDLLKEKGYKIIVVWSSDNKKKKIEEIVEYYK